MVKLTSVQWFRETQETFLHSNYVNKVYKNNLNFKVLFIPVHSCLRLSELTNDASRMTMTQNTRQP